MRATIRKSVFGLLFLGAIFARDAMAGVVFETNFDSNSDWNTNREYEIYDGCSVIGVSNSANVCPSNTYPTGWEAYRSVPVLGGGAFPPALEISRLPNLLPDHSGTGTGKAMIVNNESYTSGGVPWPGDSLLVKYFKGQTYPELYVQLWLRVAPNWMWASNGNWGGTPYPQIKFWRTGYWGGLSAPQQNIFYIPDTHPQMFIDLGHPGADGIAQAYRCDPNDYYCSNAAGHNTYQSSDYQFKTATYADGNWHKILYHIKLNTAGSYNGVMEVFQDDALVYSHYDAMWKESGSTAPGLSHVMFGGNANNPFSSKGSQWYAIDDIVISTSPIPANYTLGGAPPPVTNLRGSGKP